jgi:hypothetical protein
VLRSLSSLPPRYDETEYIIELVVTPKGAVNRVKLNQLDSSQIPKVPMVNEFSDVVFEELSVMPPNHDIESVIP